MSARGRYLGYGIGLVDDKSRVAIPSALRATVAANAPRADGKDGGTIIIGPHESETCLVAYDPAFIEIMGERLDAHEAANTGADGSYDYNYPRDMLLGEAVPFDGSGRFVMPAFPRHFAKIGVHAFFLGNNNRIEIWDPRTVLEHPTLSPRVKDAVGFYMAEKGLKL